MHKDSSTVTLLLQHQLTICVAAIYYSLCVISIYPFCFRGNFMLEEESLLFPELDLCLYPLHNIKI